ncbi:MAG: hypothetical protein HYZ00_13610 [Candidatus Hydrogenedentes bacterium]|nr:hypothetical protein [Candidatus Hydrogenedentota bacterium]
MQTCCLALLCLGTAPSAEETIAIPPESAALAPESPPAAAAGKSLFLHWVGEELAAPLAAAADQQQQAIAHMQGETAAMRQEMTAVKDEVSALRLEVQQLRETLDLLVRQIMADLEQENAQLRGALHDPQAFPGQGPRQLQQEVLGASAPALAQLPPKNAPAPHRGKVTLEIVDEWGRTPEEAPRLGPDVSSLKGVIGLVPAGCAREDLEQLGRELRAQYDAYDNINIEVFDEAGAAADFKERQVADRAHQVLTVSRHKGSGRDAISVYLEGVALEVQ